MDSDSDFMPGAYVPEPTKKKKVRTSPGKKRRLDVLEKSLASPKYKKHKRSASSSIIIFQVFSDDNSAPC